MPRKVKGFTCPICCRNGNLRQSKHHVEPKWIRQWNAPINLDVICRDCHDEVERVYDEFLDVLVPDHTEALKKGARDLHFAKRLHNQLLAAFKNDRDDIVDAELIAYFELPEVPGLYEARELVREKHQAFWETKDRMRDTLLKLNWYRIYHMTKLVIRGQVTVERALNQEKFA